MSTPVTTYDKRPVIVSPTAPTSLEQLRYLWLDISETTPVLKYYNSTGIWEAINGIDTSSFLTTNGVQTITGAKTFNTGTITVADITVDDVTIEGIDTIKLTDDDTHVPTSKLVEDTIVSAISGLETSIDGELATKANTTDVVLKTDISTSIPSAGAVDTKVASEKAVADSLTAKQNTLKYYSEGDNTVTIETSTQPTATSNISLRAGLTGLEMRMGQGVPTVKFGVLDGEDVSIGISTSGSGSVNIASPNGFKINNSTPAVTTIVDSINMEGGGENALPTASAVRIAISQIKTDLGSTLTYKGSVDSYDQLPEEAEVGDTWNVAQAYQTYPAGTNYAWTGTAWDALGGSVDLSGYQTKSDNSLATSAKTIVGAINELSADKQDTLQFYTESITDVPGYPSGSGIYKEQISLGKNNYSQTINIGGSNNLQNINLGGSVGTYGIITIGTTGNNNQIQIGRDNTSTALEINAATLNGNAIDKTALTESSNKLPTSQAVLNGLSAKQNATDNNLTTTNKTIVGAINELKTATDAMVVVSTDNAINIAPTTAQTGILIASSKTNGGNVIITPKITNTGACYLSTSSTYSNLNPIYPDPTNNKYTYPNLGTVYLFIDNAGDSADIVIENFAG